jgi:cytochrome c biogenesis protein
VYTLDEEKLLDKRIRVNDPLSFRGVTFYQSSYGLMPEAQGSLFLNIRPKNSSGAGETIRVELGGSASVPSIKRTVRFLSFAPFGMKDPATGQVKFYSSENDEYINPAAEIEVFKDNRPVYKTYVMKTEYADPYMPEDYVISYVHYAGTRFTGLQVTKDPGVWVVYTGFILLCIGPVIAFFGSHKKIWVRIQERKGQAVITVAGSANRNRIGFERQLNRFVEDISK